MPGEGTNSSRLGGTKTGSDFSVARSVFKPRRRKRSLVCIYESFSQVAGVAPRKSGKCFMGMHLPPGFGGVNLSLPRATIKAFASLHSIFSQLPFYKGGRGGFQRPVILNKFSLSNLEILSFSRIGVEIGRDAPVVLCPFTGGVSGKGEQN
jgi:hypothetical protein